MTCRVVVLEELLVFTFPSSVANTADDDSRPVTTTNSTDEVVRIAKNEIMCKCNSLKLDIICQSIKPDETRTTNRVFKRSIAPVS